MLNREDIRKGIVAIAGCFILGTLGGVETGTLSLEQGVMRLVVTGGIGCILALLTELERPRRVKARKERRRKENRILKAIVIIEAVILSGGIGGLAFYKFLVWRFL